MVQEWTKPPVPTHRGLLPFPPHRALMPAHSGKIVAVRHPKPVSEMTREELIRDIEKYAASARRTFDAGKDPGAALSRVRAMIVRYKDLSKHD